MQRINYFKILVTIVIAGLVVFGAFKFDSERKDQAKRHRIVQHVEHSLRCYQSLEADTASKAAEDIDDSNEPASPDSEAPGCGGQQRIDDNNGSLELLSDLLEKISLLKDPANNDADDKKKDSVEVEGFLKKDVELQLAEIRKSLPFTALWVPEFSSTAYNRLTTSGNLYEISSLSLIEKLTELNLAREQLVLLKSVFEGAVKNELQPLLDQFDTCQSPRKETVDSNEPVDSKEPDCSRILVDQSFTSVIQKLEQLIVRVIAVSYKAETSRQDAIGLINSESVD